jgi:NAD(P)-dependent dehydrogenase (short-subunit alcohol dehydrogenase family)
MAAVQLGPDPAPAPPPSTPPRFKGRVAIVTGAARGMGRAFAVALARDGCNLVLCDVLDGLPDGTPYPKATQHDLDETRRAAEECGIRCLAIKADMCDPSSGAALVDRAMKDLGRLDFLVANHAVTIEKPIVEMPPEVFEKVVRTNLIGVFHVLSPALKLMTAQGRGRIVIISSGSGRHAEENASAYVASKWGLIGLAKTAALEAAKSGVTVNVILPGPTDTPMMDNPIRYQQAAPDKPNPTREDYLEAKKDATPMGLAWVTPQDVAAAVLFLLSDEARFISGDTLSIDAADCARWT